MAVLSWRGLVTPKFSAPPNAETMRQTFKSFTCARTCSRSSIAAPCLVELGFHKKKFAGVPQTMVPISAISEPKFAILWAHVEEILLISFYRIVDTCLVCEDGLTKLCDGVQMAIFCVQYFQQAVCSTFQTFILNLHEYHNVWKYGRHPLCNGWE